MKLSDRELKRLLRRAVLGVSAAPLLWLPGCGREPQPNFEFNPNASVIPNRDAGVRDAGFDAGTDAGWTILYPCGPSDGPVQTSVGEVYKDGGVMLDPATCMALCPTDFSTGAPGRECSPASSWELVCWGFFCAIGRLAEGVQTHAGGDGHGRILGDMAAHEAAAVVAFEQLAVELSRHSLPEALRNGALRAAQEERRHTRLVGSLARERGGQFSVSRSKTEVRSLEAIALDNAVEGCARETFGAMVGLYQSMHATDPSLRAVMASVAEDELGHSSWSWALDGALAPRLSRQARRKIREARDEALSTLTHGVLAGRSEAERAALGLPDEERLVAMADSLRAQLF